MNTKTLLGALLTGVLAFFLGWLIFGMLLMNYYQSNMTIYDGLMKEPMAMWAIAVANLVFGLMMTYIFTLGNVSTVTKGFTTGLIVTLLMTLGFDLFMYAQFNLYKATLLAVDVIANGLFGGVIGAFLGWWLGRGTKTA
jgi:hypothetical protein